MRKKPGERLSVVSTVNHSGDSVMVWEYLEGCRFDSSQENHKKRTISSDFAKTGCITWFMHNWKNDKAIIQNTNTKKEHTFGNFYWVDSISRLLPHFISMGLIG